MRSRSKILLITLATISVLALALFSFIYSGPLEQHLTGKITSQVYVQEAPATNCSTMLYEGENYVSFFCETGRTIDNALSSDGSQFDFKAVYRFNPRDADLPWRIYNPDLPDWVDQSLSELRRKEGYVIVMNEQRMYTYSGSLIYNTEVELHPGWNLIAYPLTEEKAVDDALNNSSDAIGRIESYDEIHGVWNAYEQGSVDQIGRLEPMTAYWVYSNSTTTLDVG